MGWDVFAVLLRELDGIDQPMAVQLQGCVAVGDDQIGAETTFGAVADLLNEIGLG